MEPTPHLFEQGQVLLIDKPLDWTSFDVVRKLRRLVRTKKVGHAGTLDPLATGLLILCTGKFTKRINDFMAQEKEYTGTIVLGASTPTYDLESEPQPGKDPAGLTPEVVLETIAREFTGEIWQTPPIHSAIKVGGKRVYELARKGKDVKLEARRVVVSEFAITDFRMPVLEFRVVCSTGTYIRSLANDLGAVLGCGGYLSGLRRTRIGEFRADQAMSIAAAEEYIQGKFDALERGEPAGQPSGE
ncbi:tRNA pseudouridine(55) synthase TruB [Puia sp.]|jgi:tRNA pseudouridine55 synthase|uniref:tRNA pseudouridine(55) synthase TruB n=1 Tax=Puia sp. TaxID=2045100 RepID=UPI002F411C0C